MSVYKNNIHSSSSDIPNDYGTLTYLDNNYVKKSPGSNYNNNNFQSVDYITLPKSKQSSGQGTYLFWTLVVLLFVLALGNLILTFVILGVLRLGQGMESLELVSEENLIKFFGNTDLDRIYKRDGKLESFNQSPLEVLGDGDVAHISITDGERHITPTLEFGLRNGVVKNIESFQVRHPKTGKSIFSTNFPNFGLPRGVGNLDVQLALTKRIASPVNESLSIKSDSYTKLKGSEGTHMDGREIIWSADEDIFLKSVNKSIIFSGNDGIFIDVNRIKMASSGQDTRSHVQYKICICMPMGKLFRLPVPPGQGSQVGCHTVDLSPSQNPCM